MQNWVVVSNISYFHPLPGEMIQFDNYFLDGFKPPNSDMFMSQMVPWEPKTFVFRGYNPYL